MTMLNKKIVLGLIVLFFVGIAVGAAIAQGTTAIFTVSQGVYPGAASFTVWTADGSIYAKNAYGQVVFSGTDASTVLQAVEVAASAGNTILVKTGTYTLHSQVTFSKSLTFIGEGVSWSGSTVNPDSPPTSLSGTVFFVDGFTGTAALAIVGNINNFVMGHFGVWFDTGESAIAVGCYSTTADWGIVGGIIEDISVLNNSGAQFAYYFQNFQHLSIRNLRAWGGAFMACIGDDSDIDYGNTVFSECYAYVDRAVSTPAILYFKLTAGNKMNLIECNHVQVNAKASDTTAVLKCDGCRYISFNTLNIETNNQWAMVLANSEELTFNNPYVWCENVPPEGQKNIHWEDSCSYICMFGGMLDVKQLDTGTGAGNLICAPKQNWLISNAYCAYTGTALGYSGTDYVAGIYMGPS